MRPPPGEYRYDLRRRGELIGRETATITEVLLKGFRLLTAGSQGRYEIEADLREGSIESLRLRYSSGPFSRSAAYRVDTEMLRGQVSAGAGASAAESKLGRFKELDAGLTIVKAMLLAHIRERGSKRWTGRVAVIDPTTLMPRTMKQTWWSEDDERLRWIGEPAMGERERVELDSEGRLLRRIDPTGIEAVLVGS